MVLIYFVVIGILAVWTAKIASEKNRSVAAWAIASIFFPGITLLLIWLARPNVPQKSTQLVTQPRYSWSGLPTLPNTPRGYDAILPKLRW